MIDRRAFLLGAAATVALSRRPGWAAAATAPWTEAWEGVLRKHVDSVGRVAFGAIQRDPGPLKSVVDAIAEIGPFNRPDLFPSRSDQIAYWINAYNATSMWGVVQCNVPERFDLIDRYRFFIGAKHRIGGRSISLDALETEIVRPLGEERVHFALNCMVRDCPRLPREAFRADRLENQLASAARLFCTESRTIRPDPEHASVWLSQIFDFYTKDFVPAKAPSLIEYINRWRATPLPDDARVRFIPYDWTVNRQPDDVG